MWSYFSLLSVFVRVCVVLLLTTVSVCEGMCGLTSHYCQCLRGYVWSYFSLLSVFERVCVVLLLTTVSVCEGMCGHTSHYCQCL